VTVDKDYVAPDPLLTALAQWMLEEPARLDLIENARRMLSADAFMDLCSMLEVCPIHLSDTDSCADDERKCYTP
jgi:hypothetical protein